MNTKTPTGRTITELDLVMRALPADETAEWFGEIARVMSEVAHERSLALPPGYDRSLLKTMSGAFKTIANAASGRARLAAEERDARKEEL